MCWPIVPVLWAFLNINAQYIMISDIVTPIREEMLRLAPSYSPSTYTQLQLLSRLITFTNISPHVINLGRSVWQGLTVYLVSLVILCVVWIPFLVSSHRENKVQSDKIERVSRAPRRGSDVSYLMKQQLDIVRRHTVLVYIIVVLHVPALACALSFQSQVFFADPLWWASIELGLDLPFSLLGNLKKTTKRNQSTE
ncbi:hypothetical protein CROQUDRAFT_495162 [Cronartium quercuum f. sp. fusiforme G11]|uniref:G protein-coupled receptor n=1 Tax=Cronartium quercuum f. sp. fusiforme G11 TaxID=708437 RepID=A0A9P6NHA6_9BASI|nr:hypothetical protein CROQUDRAFT_495162 [Cronartium quercuum f. sp. fusiforme G11]